MSLPPTTSRIVRLGVAIIAGVALAPFLWRATGERWWLPWVVLAAFWAFLLYRFRGRPDAGGRLSTGGPGMPR